MDWSLLACASSGHITYRPDDPVLAGRLSVASTPGEAWRCLRCGDFVVGTPSRSGPTSSAPEVVRGRLLRDLILMRLLAIERVIEGSGLALVAIAVWKWQDWKAGFASLLTRELPILQQAAEQFGWDLQHSLIARWALDLAHVDRSTLFVVGALMAAYGLLRWTEAVGLWLAKRWGEYLAVVLTTVFLPWEVIELVHHPTVIKGVLLVVNIAAIAWLVWTKYLFGFRGGRAALDAERASVSILEVEQAALAGTG